MIMLTTMLASSIYSLDLTIVSIALPHMRGTFAAAPDQIAWVVTAFILGATIMVIGAGWLGARFGRKPLFVASIAGFTGASVMCANAGTLEAVVAWRFLQGLAGASLIPLSQAIAVDAYPREQYGRALGLWGIGGMIGPVLAPSLGGYITDAYGWSGVFYLNLPLGILTVLGAVAFVPRESTDPSRRLDWFGLLALLAGVGALQLMLNRGARLDWFGSSEVVVELAVAIGCLYLFLASMLVARNPFLRPELFRDWNYALGLVTIFIFGGLIFLPIVLLPLLLEGLRGFPAETIGVLLTPRAVGVAISSMLVGRLAERMSLSHLTVLGFLGMSLGAWWMSRWTFDVGAFEVMWVGFVHGFMSSFVFMPVNMMAFSTLATRYRTEAVPLFYLAINLGASMGIAAVITFWAQEAQESHAVLSEHVTPFRLSVERGLAPEGSDPAARLAALDAEVTRQAEMIAYNNSFFLIAAVSLLAAPLGFVLRRPARARATSAG